MVSHSKDIIPWLYSSTVRDWLGDRLGESVVDECLFALTSGVVRGQTYDIQYKPGNGTRATLQPVTGELWAYYRESSIGSLEATQSSLTMQQART